MKSPLAAWRDRSDLTLDEVVDTAERLLHEIAPRQTKWAVSARPDVRTIRYYTTRGLLPKPVGYDGGRARYGYSHLVRLLAIKRMQAEHMTLEQIARVLAKTDDEALAALVETKEKEPALLPPVTPPGLTPNEVEPQEKQLRSRTELEFPGGKLIVDEDTLEDSAKRARLADNLESLARLLRAMEKKQGGSDA